MARGQVVGSGISAESNFEVVSAVSFERRTVRVLFTEQPKAVLKTGADDALNPDNWTITPRPDFLLPDGNLSWTTVVPVLVKLVPGSPLEIDVVVDLDFSFDISYEVTLASAVIAAGNIGGWVAEGNRSAIFRPYDPDCRKKPVVRVFDWFGRAARRYDITGDSEKLISLLQDLLEQTKALIDCFPDQFNPLYCREDFLDSRMYSLGNPFEFVTSEMTVTEKRRVALQLIEIYRLKGTVPGIQRALQNILGVSPIQVLSFNENAWRLGDTHLRLGIPAPADPDAEPYLGGGLFVPTGGPPGYPTDPIDPYNPESYPYTGTCFLAGSPMYNQAPLGGGDLLDDTKGVARIGMWNLALDGQVDAGLNPADLYAANPSAQNDDDIGVTQERDRRGMRCYRVILPNGFSPTSLELQRIQTIAEYMQPATMHLHSIRLTPDASLSYDPLVLGASWLGVDWLLH